MSEAERRFQRTRQAIDWIIARKGHVYTLGLLMGIVCRLSRTDFQLVEDLEQRAQDLKH